MYPKEYLYSKEHEWVEVDGDVCTLGITDFAQNELGEVVFSVPATRRGAWNIQAVAGPPRNPIGIDETSYVRPPSEAIATNQRFDAHFNDLRESWRLSPGQMAVPDAS